MTVASAQNRSSERPIVGVCAAAEVAAWSFWKQPAHLVADSYVGGVLRAGGMPLLLPVQPDPEPMLALLDGLLLIGGADVDPSAYGAEPDPATEATAPERDSFEIALVRGARRAGLPVLGICRGMQIVNVALGGTLRQDVRDADGTTPHRLRLGGFEGTEHVVALAPGSLAARAAGELEHRVHCHHHQAVDALGAGLAVTGRDERDQMPEALEARDGSWLLGVQWHPEAVSDGPVLERFVEACREAAARPRPTTHDVALAASRT